MTRTTSRVRALALAVTGLALVACSTAGEPTGPDGRGAPPGGAATGLAVPADPEPSGIGEAASLGRPPARLGRRPNLLVITTDDMRGDDLRFMPRTRRLIGGAGLTFENSFAPNPLCCPSRASFLTGRNSHNHRVLSHVEPFGFRSFDDRRTLATELRRSGYRTGLVGKYLNGYGEQPTRTGRPSLRYVPPGWTRWRASTDSLWGNGQYPGHGGTYQFFDTTLNVDGQMVPNRGRYSTDLTAEVTQDLVTGFGRGGAPWFVWWTPVAPHHGGPREADDPAPTRRPDGGRFEWPTPARPGWVKGSLDAQIPRASGVPATGSSEADVSDKPRYIRKRANLTPAEERAGRELTRQRAESLKVLDLRVAETLGVLRRTGQLDRTIVVFTSDNGFYLGEHRHKLGKINLHEPSIRVPLLVRGPGVPRGRRFDPVTTADVAVTLAATGGARLPGADGAAVDLTTGRDAGWTRPVVLEGLMQGSGGYGRPGVDRGYFRGLTTSGVRLGRYKLIRYTTGETEVYDLRSDPLELYSLHRDRALTARLLSVWRRYAACAGPACRVPLPPDLQLDPAGVRAVTTNQLRADRDYFG